ncbi:MAG TPA: FlgD immunoglobulin-like domain containing protein [Rhodothermales bacterium]|nr:FlgD immunoglobulin-like domain containing protein [Rhodothermales bacterium]
MNRSYPFARAVLPLAIILVSAAMVIVGRSGLDGSLFDDAISQNSRTMMEEGRETFRHDTFGDEAFWSGSLRLHESISGEEHGGVGPGLSPETALSLGLKVDTEALPQEVLDAIAAAQVDLQDPAVTLTLLKADAVVGVKGTFEGDRLSALGVTCAFCHSTVDDSFAPGLGKRLDGWANRDLDVGAIIAFAPDVGAIADLLGTDHATVRTVLHSWGPGKFDAALLMDGKAFRPDGKPAATLLPPAFGLAGVNLHTWTGWGSVTHWNAFVANLEMIGQGTFYDPRLDDAEKFPIAAREGFGHRRSDPDLVTPKLAALQFYQLAIPAPSPPDGSFDVGLAAAGEQLFKGKAQCASCHVPPLFTEPGYNMHTPEEIGIDAFQAERSPDGRYRTAPLKGLWTHTRGGFYHDGRFATLGEVVDHYDAHFGLSLSDQEREELVNYLLSLGDAEASVGTTVEPPSVPDGSSSLEQNYPNPFSDGTTVTYKLDRPSEVTIEVFSITGHLVRKVNRGEQSAGPHVFTWDGLTSAGRPAVSGVYLYGLRAGDQTITRKMLLVR